MRIAQRGLDALPAPAVLAQHPAGILKSEPISAEKNLSKKVLQAILVELMRVRIVDSIRGANGGYQSQGSPKKTSLVRILLDVRNASANSLDHTSLSDLCCCRRN